MRCQHPKANQATSQRKKGFMHECGALITDAQPFELVQPGDRPLTHPAVNAQAAAMRLPSASQSGLDLTLAQFFAVRLAVIGPVAIQLLGPLARPAGLAC